MLKCDRLNWRLSWWLCLAMLLVGGSVVLPSLSEARAFRASARNYTRQRSRLFREYRRARQKKNDNPCRSVGRLTTMKTRLEGYLEPGGMRGSRRWKRKLAKLFRVYIKNADRWLSRLATPCEKQKEYQKWRDQITGGYSDAIKERKAAPCMANAKLSRYKMVLTPDNAVNWSQLERKYRRKLNAYQRKYRIVTARRLRSTRAGCRSKYGSGYQARIAKALAELRAPKATSNRPSMAFGPTPTTPTPSTARPTVRRSPAVVMRPVRRDPPPIDLPPDAPTPRQRRTTPQPTRRVATIDGPGEPGVARKAASPALTRVDQPLFLEAGMKFFSRTFFYSDDLFGVLRPYNLLMAPAIQIDGRWHPLAHFMRGPLAHIGIIAQFYYALGLGSRTPEGKILETTAFGFHAGLCGRIPIGPVAIRLSFAYGQQIFAIGQEAPKSVPDVAYQWLRFAAGARWVISDRFALTANFAYLFVLDAGEMWSDAFFPRASVGGIDGRLALAWSALRFLDIHFGVRMQHYFHTMNPEPGDRRVAGGAVDQFLNFELGVTLRL